LPLKLPLPPRIRLGDRVRLKGMAAALEVIDITDPALVTLRAPNGATLKAGRLAVVPVDNNRDTMQAVDF
jgi:hypothetical protein